ncbi:MAG: hypothetical protein M3619_25780 [Myxococcota bacterium]|nr:hypothetical protein [Myxococcota bacterium]
MNSFLARGVFSQMPAQPDLARTAESDQEAFRQFVIFIGGIAVAVGITIASLVIAGT